MAKIKAENDTRVPIFMITVMRMGWSYLDNERCACGIYHSHHGTRTAKGQRRSFRIIRSTTWGFGHTLEEAMQDVEDNALDMCEAGYYDMAVIEETRVPGLIVDGEWWYKWRGKFPGQEGKQGGFKRCRKPRSLKQVVHFWG